ncbi:DEAD/DEAH box helicase [Arenibacter lacus]|uniref:DEAD/DEAH box helicase n=1 Tax=Arenibacter lacus TaxID=2608629 RepID=UPI00123DD8FE|nr:DEAD/DEAH box helicase [Arenibacter lacus]
MTFKELGIIEPILKALAAEGYTKPTPIQEQSIPILLKGKDLLGCAQTGTGKTAAFSIPIIQQLVLDREADGQQRKIRTLVVTPTRELAIQIGENFTSYARHTGIRNTVIFGGVKQGRQTDALKRGVDVLIATPGRLLDLMNQGFISLKDIKYAVLDEADQMLDMGFIHDIKKIIAKLPNNRQSLFFSATMPKAIVELSRKLLGDFEQVTIKPQQATAEKVEQAIYFVAKKNKPKLLTHLLEKDPNDSTLVFSRTKHGANKIVKQLAKADIKAEAIHGNKSQNARQKSLGDFKNGDLKVLIATDIAARGIDVEDLSLVINYDLPNVPETYVHRIGRTGRASASGIAVSFCDAEERPYLKSIQKLINQQVPTITDHPFVDDGLEEVPLQPEKKHGNHKQRPRTGHSNPRGGRNNNRGRNTNHRPKRD